MNVHLGTEGGNERVIFCTAPGFVFGSFYLAVRVMGRYYRLAMGPRFGIYVGRS